MNKNQKPWMIYGANGFTGKLIAEEAKRRNMSFVLAGRSDDKIQPLAKKLEVPYEIFSLSSVDTIKEKIKSCSLVLLCAGPFSKTSEPMVKACLELGIHYLDITGEIEVLDQVLSIDAQAKKSGSVLIPGVGFDVVPSDCLAKLLSERLPHAEELNLAFRGDATLSPGTTKTMIENLPKGGKIRKDGKLKSIPSFSQFRQIPFLRKTLFCSSIPWGDVASAYYSTGIPNISVYGPTPKWSRLLRTPMKLMGPALSKPKVQKFLNQQIEKYVKGPSEEQQKTSRMELWGEVKKGAKRCRGHLEIPEGYHFTMLTALKSVEKVLLGEVSPGSYTPSLAFGANFIREFSDISLNLESC
ncbi:MAG: saccharopine dehydrogenase family protein [Deltaproteobacteria bacterium]